MIIRQTAAGERVELLKNLPFLRSAKREAREKIESGKPKFLSSVISRILCHLRYRVESNDFHIVARLNFFRSEKLKQNIFSISFSCFVFDINSVSLFLD